MNKVVADETRHQTTNRDNDNADDQWESAWIDGRQGLTTENDRCDGKAEPVKESCSDELDGSPLSHLLRQDIQDGVDSPAHVA